MKYTYLKGHGHTWRVILPKMTESQAVKINTEVGIEMRRLYWTGESGRKKKGRK